MTNPHVERDPFGSPWVAGVRALVMGLDTVIFEDGSRYLVDETAYYVMREGHLYRLSGEITDREREDDAE